MIMEPKYLAFRRWLYTPIIIWQGPGGWIHREYIVYTYCSLSTLPSNHPLIFVGRQVNAEDNEALTFLRRRTFPVVMWSTGTGLVGFELIVTNGFTRVTHFFSAIDRGLIGRGPPCGNPIPRAQKQQLLEKKKHSPTDSTWILFIIVLCLFKVVCLTFYHDKSLKHHCWNILFSSHWTSKSKFFSTCNFTLSSLTQESRHHWWIWQLSRLILFTTPSILCLPNTVRYHTFTQSSWFVGAVISLCSGTWSW